MFAILLLACHVTGEWVEIAQNHYRKEPSRRVTLNNQDSAANKIYTNYSITERPWNRGIVTRIPNPGSIKRVQIPNVSKDPFSSTNLYEDDLLAEPTKLNIKKQFESFDAIRPTSIKRTGNFNAVNNKSDRDATRKFSEPQKLLDEGAHTNKKVHSRFHTPSRHFYQPDSKVNRVIVSSTTSIGDKKGIVEQKYQEIDTFKENDKTRNNLQKNRNFKNATKVHTSEFTDLVQNLNSDSRGKHKEIVNKENSIITKTDSISNVGTISNLSQDLTAKASIIINNENKGTNKLKENNREVNKISKPIQHEEEDTKVEEENSKTYDDNQSQNKVDSFVSETYADQESSENEDRLLQNESKTNSIEVIWKMMKLVTDNISRNTRRSFRSKIKYLEGLQNTILSNIEDRIEQAWPDEGRARLKRSARGHVEFPSSESALMTISFLTFAVFLIKLVLQVIHTYKNKTMMVTPAVVAAVGRAASTLTKTPDN